MHSPYKGLTPYEENDRPYFFGRDSEREIVAANLKAARLTILYGASGVGKTSLLRAGVVHDINAEARRLLERSRQPEFVVAYCQDWREDPVAKISLSLRHAWQQVALEPIPEQPGLTALIEASARALKASLLLVFDQFEDYLYSRALRDGLDIIDRELIELLTVRSLKVHLLISLRDDALAKLDQFKGRIDSLFDNSLRIDHLDLTAAREAILRPVAALSRIEGLSEIQVEPELVEEIVEQVRTGKLSFREGTEAQPKLCQGDRVETPYLQLVLNRIWDHESNAGTNVPKKLRLETLQLLGNSASIVRSHIDVSMNSFSEEERRVAERVFFYLVTPSGTKIAHTASDLAAFADLDEESVKNVLNKLAGYNHRILRAVPVLDGPSESARYEIYHDALFDAILEWRLRFRASIKQRELENELAERQQEERRLREREEEKERANRQRRTAIVSVIVAFLCLGLAGTALQYAYRADHARRFALRQEAIAREQRQIANASLNRVRKSLLIREAGLEGDQNALNQLLGTLGKSNIRFFAISEDLEYKNPEGREVFRFRLGPEPSTLSRDRSAIAFITYFSDNDYAGPLRYRFMTGGRKSDFNVTYVRWACLKNITALVEYSDPEREPTVVKFDGCMNLPMTRKDIKPHS